VDQQKPKIRDFSSFLMNLREACFVGGTRQEKESKMPAGVYISVDVPDLEKGIAFYRDGLGFEFRRYMSEHTVAEMQGAGVTLSLLETAEGSQAVAGKNLERHFAGDHWTPVHFDILVDNLEAAQKKAEQAGAHPAKPAWHDPYGKIVTMRDPFGHGFCLIEMHETGYDSIADPA
jgi:predicted enzyme related to lactoylglutathione lyase